MSPSPTALPKGALVAVDPTSGAKQSISFQYNPETLRRTIEPNTVGGKPGSRSRAVRFAGAATETVTIDCRFAATDPPGDAGIAPQLAALAVLLYPRSADVLQAQRMLDAGSVEVVPALASQLLFVFGGTRVVPCELTSCSIVEELYDGTLTPVLATVTLTLRATTYSDVASSNTAFSEFIAYQQGLEQLASTAYASGGPGGT